MKTIQAQALPTWWDQGRPVPNDWDKLAKESCDVESILEFDDLDPSHEWRVCRVPISSIRDEFKPKETPAEAEERFERIRNADSLCKPIYGLLRTGDVVILDGWHRLQISKERGETEVEALVTRSTK